MKLTVLGAAGAFPGPNQACSGYVVEAGDTRIVVDLGWGTLTRLFGLLGAHTGSGVDAVVITHEHPDHMADLYGLFRARWYGRRNAPAIPLIAPRGVYARLADAEDGDTAAISTVFDWIESPGEELQIGTISISTLALPHYVPNVGVRLAAKERVIAFSGDCGPADELADLGRDADLFVVDATDRQQQPGVEPPPTGTPPLNMTSTQAGEAARAAGARQLLLTHLWPGNDPGLAVRDASTTYEGEIAVATDGLTVYLPDM